MTNELVKPDDFSIIEQVVMQGDLSKLSAQQRVTYYNKVCESCGLNPLTNPFSYISLNGKLTLYAKKDCTEQLRKINGVSIESLEDKVIDDLYIVTAKARDKHGRLDQSTGAVVIGHLKGENKANAIMKAETKAKRRVTLSICGMGWTDESEIDSIPNAKTVDVDLGTGEIKDVKQLDNALPISLGGTKIDYIHPDGLMSGKTVKPLDTPVKSPNTPANTPVENVPRDDVVKPERASPEEMSKMEELSRKYPPEIKDRFDDLWIKNYEMYGFTTKKFCITQIDAARRYLHANS